MAHAAHVILLLLFFIPSVCAQWNFVRWDSAFRADPRNPALVNRAVEAIEDQYLYNKPDSALLIADRILAGGISSKDPLIQFEGWYQKGAALHQKGAFDHAEASLNTALGLAQRLHDTTKVTSTQMILGFICEGRGDRNGALGQYLEVQKLLDQRSTVDSLGYRSVYLNIAFLYLDIGLSSMAEEYMNKYLTMTGDTMKAKRNALAFKADIAVANGDHAHAITYYESALVFAKEQNNKLDEVTLLCYIGEQKMQLGRSAEARSDFTAGVRIAQQIGNDEWWARMKVSLGTLAVEDGRYNEAVSICTEALGIADGIGDRRTQHDACSSLLRAYRALGQPAKALHYNDRVVELEKEMRVDELSNSSLRREYQVKLATDSVEKEKEILRSRMEHQAEVAKLDRTRDYLIGGALLLLVAASGFFSRMRYMQRAKVRMEREKERSDDLLLNILPAEVAEELKRNGASVARDFDLVSILFTDFKDFTRTSEKLDAAHLVEEVNACFTAFDAIMEKYGIEKIKTIGDAYMCAGGLPLPSADSALNTVMAGLEMQAFVSARKLEREAVGLLAFEMRCGIHTGPVVAGIVGVKKFQYDLWGDTVNTASRMETSGEVGKVNISGATYAQVKNAPGLAFTPRGKIQAKGKGEMEMYFVERGG
ncbi:MAG: adenylate/guanylate cyclase domain-containing protein [Flavobacteriales bacterium]